MFISLQGVTQLARSIFNVGVLASDNTSDKIDPTLLDSRGSMTRLLADYIIEPTFVISESANNSEAIKDIIEMNINMFASFVTHTFITLVAVNGVKPRVAFKAISSARGKHLANLVDSWKARVSNESDLLSSDEIAGLSDLIFANEDEDSYKEVNRASAKDRSGKEAKQPIIVSKIIDVSFSANGKDVVVPIMIRPAIYVVSESTILDYVTVETDREGFMASYHRLRSKQDSLLDFITGRKLLEEDRRKLLNDEADVIKELNARKMDAIGNNSATGVGFAYSYGTLIISTREKQLVNTAIRGKVDKDSDKNKLLDRIGSFNFIVLDDDFATASIYTSYARGVSEVEYGQIKPKSENKMLETFLKSMSGSDRIRL